MANQPKKYKKFVATAATATLVASAIVPVASAASLTDIAGNTHEAAITSLVDAGIINGYADGTFKPNKTLTRSDVVKLLGKYLVSEGYAIPSDAVTSPRFSDLTSKSNKELLEYAAVVADAGVFAGSNGKLLAGDPITRENMAIVLVRMVNTLKDVNLEDYVDGQKFDKEVKDLNVAKAEARTAINVLDFYDITTATNFLPKNTVTRGQFATFLNNVIKADFSGASAATGTVKAINATTVEVTFADEVDNINALKFTIDGLTISNAAVKQTDKKTVVLTTSAQTAGVEYTVKESGNEIGKFTGITAVIPTSIDVVTKSIQGVLGKEVTVSAKVTVPAGQSAAGIPVTFNVPAQGSLANAITTEATTNADGVATYTYTRYAAVTDDVVAYATGDRTKFSAAKVYWATAAQLTITEKTEGNVLTNGAKKVFEINAPSKAGKYVFVTFTNNVGVTTDKLTRSVFAEGTGLWEQTGSSIGVIGAGTSQFPYEITNGANRVVPVLLDSKGKANLVLSGTNGKVTPVVYEGVLKTSGLSTNPGSVATDFANILYNPTALQAKAAEVSFEIKHTLGLTVEAKGVSNAAVAISGTQTGGRDYTATYVDKDGKPAKAGDIVYVAIQNNRISSANAFLVDADGNELANTVADGYKYYALAVKGTEGKVNFTVASYHEEAFAAPIVFVNNGTGPDAYKSFLDASDLQAQAESVYFTKAVQYTAELVALDKNGDETKSVRAGGDEFVEYSYNLLDQNGKPRAYTAAATNVTFNFTAGTNTLLADGTRITPGNPGSVTRSIAAGALSTKVIVTSAEGGSVTGYATASHVGAAALPSTDAVTVQFTAVSTLVTRGTLDATIAATGTTINIEGVPYSLSGATYLNNGTVVPTLGAFRAYLVAGVTVDVTKDKDGNLVFNVVPAATVTPSLVTKAEVSGTNTVQLTFSGAVNTSPTASQFAIDFNGNGTIETNEYATVAVGSGSVLTLTFASVHNLSTSTVTVPNLKYTPTFAGTLLTVASANVTTAFTTPVTVATAAHGVTIAGSTAPTVGAAAVALNNVLTIPAGSVTTAGNVIVTLKADKAGVTSAIEVPVAVTLLDDEKTVATKIATALNALSPLTAKFTVVASDNKVTVKAIDVDTADVAANLAVGIADPAILTTPTFTAVFSGLTAVTTGVTTPGSINTFAKTNAKFTLVTGTSTVKPLIVKVLSTNGSTVVDTSVTVAVAAGDSAATVATKVKAALEANAAITSNYTVSIATDEVTLTNKVAEAVTTTITFE